MARSSTMTPTSAQDSHSNIMNDGLPTWKHDLPTFPQPNPVVAAKAQMTQAATQANTRLHVAWTYRTQQDSTLHERAAVPDQPRGNVVVGWEGLIVTVRMSWRNQLPKTHLLTNR
jgi:hypothetical protein